MATRLLRNFFVDEDGQDLIEYTLLLAFVAMCSSALFIGSGQSTRQIWNLTDSRLEQASEAAGARPAVIEKRREGDDD